MADTKSAGAKGEVETTGHSYDGIQEYNNPLPRWWLWTFYITIVWGIAYTIAYPAWPLISGATEGMMGWSTRANVAKAIEEHEAKNADLVAQLNAADLAGLDPTGALHRYAVARGEAVFRANCSQCHGAGAAGVQAGGYPSMLDDEWLWGGTQDALYTTIAHGIRSETDPDTRFSQMPAFGEILEPQEISNVVEYVYSLSRSDADATMAAAGETVFADNCAACHGDEANGDQSIGAPNLSDEIWLYGGDRATLAESVTNARYGVMPAWGQRLDEEDLRAVAVYVHSRGFGE